MKMLYILIVLAVAAFTLGCIDRNQSETTIVNTGQNPVSSGGSPVTAATPSEVTQTPAPGEDIFGTYSDLATMDNVSSDMDMQIALSNEI